MSYKAARMKVIVSAGGRFHALHLAHQLEKKGHLERLYTAAYKKSDISYVNSKKVRLYTCGKILDWCFEKFRLSKIINLSWWYKFKDHLFDIWVCKNIQQEEPFDIFIGWAHYFLESLPQVKKKGALVILESGSMHILEQQKILQEEYQNFNLIIPPIDAQIVQKILAEYAAVDYIMVPAQHVLESFVAQGISRDKMRCVPYGVSLARFFPATKIPKKFRVLFVGQVSLQKGVFYLLRAWQKLQLSNAELVIVGTLNQDFMEIYHQFKSDISINFMGPVSQEKLACIYREASLFMLPSLQEGIAMVQAEAMASGLPLICTTNSGGEVFLQDNNCGFVVPIRDAKAIAEKITLFYDNPEMIKTMGARAAQVIKVFSWDEYGKNVIKVYQELLEKR